MESKQHADESLSTAEYSGDERVSLCVSHLVVVVLVQDADEHHIYQKTSAASQFR